jgi:hypothetical protein
VIGRSAGFPACGLTGLSSPVSGAGDWKVARTRRQECLRYDRRRSNRTLVLPLRFSHNNRMSAVVTIAIHASQFPENVRRDLLTSLRTRCINHKFHYDSLKQTQKWLALHQACSPSRLDPDCAATYDHAFTDATRQISARRVHVIGLGCGGGQKDTRLLQSLRAPGREVFYSPCDVSTAMVLVARKTALTVIPPKNCFPSVFDLAAAVDLPAIFRTQSPAGATRVITFFGMIPNFEPQTILPKLDPLVRRDDILMLSANLAPGDNYSAGMKRILPQYDNDLTRDWLMTLLLDLGVERRDGEIRFRIEDNRSAMGLKRVAAYFHFRRSRTIRIDRDEFNFRAGSAIRLFFSYRLTSELIGRLFARRRLKLTGAWIARSGEEGVYRFNHG